MDPELIAKKRSPFRAVKRFVILIVGFTVLLIGVAMILLPGPAFILIPLGLGILGLELAWARRLRERLMGTISRRREARRNAGR